MKKFSFIIALLFIFVLSACAQDDGYTDTPQCEEGFTLQFGECIAEEELLVCEEGFHKEEDQCVANTITCEDGLVEEAGECVELDLRIQVGLESNAYQFIDGVFDGVYDYYHEDFEMTTSFITNVYSVYDLNDTLTGYMFMATGDGRWGDVTYLISLNTLGVIHAFDVLESSENWGSFIELDSFQDQFTDMEIGYYLLNDFELGVDGNASATTTIPLTLNVLQETANLYADEFN